ncbi:hypothetical protein ISN44_As11g032830 [Arabidopsis suecica]|uniref:Uncharacterized protein n=1 Tax=Arabidopsis suecica TaxID=45249 RepID=A0A8T1ZF34_ARASU|nr:hypothetical protein ISN44_As11g032830 [Arabidopsis suecica]
MKPEQRKRQHHGTAKGSTLGHRKTPGRRRSRTDLQTEVCSTAKEAKHLDRKKESLHQGPTPSTGRGGREQRDSSHRKPAVAHGGPSTLTTRNRVESAHRRLQGHMRSQT